MIFTRMPKNIINYNISYCNILKKKLTILVNFTTFFFFFHLSMFLFASIFCLLPLFFLLTDASLFYWIHFLCDFHNSVAIHIYSLHDLLFSCCYPLWDLCSVKFLSYFSCVMWSTHILLAVDLNTPIISCVSKNVLFYFFLTWFPLHNC